MIDGNYKYFAFISYSSKDTEWGKRLQRKLEHYRMPAALCHERGWQRTPIKPVFFAPTDIQPGGLTSELQERLQASRNLIVVCSPHSAQSEWVGREIAFFHQLGRTNHIHFFIVDGVPHSGNAETECFNPIIGQLGLPEILGANVHERVYRWPWMNRERAYVQLISKLLGVEFDAIWQRHRRMLRRQVAAWGTAAVAVLAVVAGIWLSSQPVDVTVRLNEASVYNADLPPLKDAVVTMTLENETKTDTIRSIDENTIFTNIPHRLINSKVRIRIECRHFQPTDTTTVLTKDMCINIYRNAETFGNMHFRLWNPDTEQTSPHTTVTIDGHTTQSDANGYVTLTIPLPEQKVAYPISARTIKLVNDSVFLPCGSNDVIIFKNY